MGHPYSFINLLPLFLSQPTQRVRILPRVRLRRCRRRCRLLRLLRSLGPTKVCRGRVAQSTMPREGGGAEGHGVCVDRAVWHLCARVGARREGLAGGHGGRLVRGSRCGSSSRPDGFFGWEMSIGVGLKRLGLVARRGVEVVDWAGGVWRWRRGRGFLRRADAGGNQPPFGMPRAVE